MTLKYYICILLLFCTSGIMAQSFTSSVSKTQVATGEQFEVSFTLNSNGDRYSAPNFNGFEVLSGPNESTSMSSINGSMSQSISISYVLMAAKEGTYTVGSASVVSNGKQLTTKPITIRVVKGAAVRQQSNAQQGGGQDVDVTESSSADLSKSLFIKAVVDKTHVYQGEQITVTYKLYTRVSLVANDLDKAPDFTGFWSQDIRNTNQNIPWNNEVYKGQGYKVADIKQTVLIPEHAGDLTVDPLAMSFVVRQSAPPKDIMEQMFGGSYKDVKYKAQSTPVIIHVKPLPEAGKPAGFSGAVGRFTINAGIDKNELKANEALNYRLKIAGTGNIKLIQNININPPTDFEKYDPKVTDTLNTSGVSGNRIFTYLLIPRHQGNYTMAPVQFSYFNPATEKYVTLSTPAFPIKVNKGLNENNVTSLPTAKQDVRLLNKDIRYIKTSGLDAYKDGEGFFGSAFYWLLLLLGPMVFIGFFAYRRWNEEQNSDVVRLKSRMANKIATRHLANAQKQLQAGDTKAFYEAISKGVYGYLSDKLNIPAANLDQENITAELRARSLDEGLIKQLTETLNLCEMARFAPVSGISQQEVFDKAKSMINDIENKI